MTSTVVKKAFAKLNLTLEVTGLVDSGLHMLSSVMQSIDLCDVVSVAVSEKDALEVRGLEIPLPRAQQNTAYKALNELRQFTGVSEHVRIVIDKRIPIASGLGGGSADAAAVLHCLNELWELNLSDDNLAQIGLRVGSDVPFLIFGGLALVEGVGEIITNLRPPTESAKVGLFVWRGQAGFNSKTASVFAQVTKKMWTNGAKTREVARHIEAERAIRQDTLFNIFSVVAPELWPEWRQSQTALSEKIDSELHLTGTGPTLFTFIKPGTDVGELKNIANRNQFEFVMTKTANGQLFKK